MARRFRGVRLRVRLHADLHGWNLVGVPKKGSVTPRSSTLLLFALFAGAFGLSTGLAPFYEGRNGRAGTDMLVVLLGDSRRLLANQFFAKADAYYHAGYYPGVFDKQLQEGAGHMVEEVGQSGGHEHDHDPKGGAHEDHDDDDYLGPPRDWIDSFARF